MARRVSRRSQGELLIHKWWFNGILALILLGLAALILYLSRDSDSLMVYALAIILVAGGLNRVVRGWRYVSEL